MSAFLADLSALGDAIFDCLTQIFSLYTSVVVLSVALGVWVLRRIVRLFHLF